MKIAIVSDDGANISQHFGQAELYIVLTVRNGKITAEERRPKLDRRAIAEQPSEESDAQGRHGFGAVAESRRGQMAKAISDCQVVIAGGMGWSAHESLERLGIKVVLTDAENAREAAVRHAGGNLPNLIERLR